MRQSIQVYASWAQEDVRRVIYLNTEISKKKEGIVLEELKRSKHFIDKESVCHVRSSPQNSTV